MIGYSKSARMRYTSDAGILCGGYFGFITQDHFMDLGRQFLDKSDGEQIAVADMSKCLTAFRDVPLPLSYGVNNWIGAVIVRPDQYATWQAYSKSIAKAGIIRMVFLEEEREIALRVLRHSLTLST